MSCKSESNTSSLEYCRTEADIDSEGAKLDPFTLQNSKLTKTSKDANLKLKT